jgi:hypothetical protein
VEVVRLKINGGVKREEALLIAVAMLFLDGSEGFIL